MSLGFQSSRSPCRGSTNAGQRHGRAYIAVWLLVLQAGNNGVSAAVVKTEPVDHSAPARRLAFLGTGASEKTMQPSTPAETEIDASLAKATDAAKVAWLISKQVSDSSQAVLKSGNTITAQIELAKSAAETAKEEDEKATKLFYKTRNKAVEAAVFASREYYEQIKKEASKAAENIDDELKKAAAEAEVKAAKAASAAAMPYQEQLLRGQKVIVDYQKKAQALAAASNNLKTESSKLAFSASQYQMLGQVVRARQMMMQAHSLFDEGEGMKNEALKLNEAAQQIHSALPAYQLAEQAAATAAAAGANPLSSDMMEQFTPY